MGRILVADDHDSLRRGVARALTDARHEVDEAPNGNIAIEKLHEGQYDVILSDLKMGGSDGMDVLRTAKALHPTTAVILMTAFGSINTAVEAMKIGAFDYVQKPFEIEEMELKIEKAIEHRRLKHEIEYLRHTQQDIYDFDRIVGASGALQFVLGVVKKVAKSNTTVLIRGETGTGKELIASGIHYQSRRHDKLFVAQNCAALPENLLESELFGHKKGSFTSADSDKKGLFEIADGGTLFLDEVGEMPLSLQAKVLRTLQEGTIRPVGSTSEKQVDARIICATNRDLEKEVAAGRFREDLFYRLETFHVVLPPLRERPDDIPVIAAHFIEKAFEQHPKQVTFTAEAVEAMRDLPLKGNARELRSLIERTMLTAEEGTLINKEMVEIAARRETQQASLADPWAGFSLKDEVHRFEQRFIELALKNADGKVSRAARLLGFKHHESLNSLLKNRFQNLLDERTPATPRRRSIIRQYVN